MKYIKDPIHGYIRLNDLELALIETRAVQRLRRIRQLAGSEYVYPGAIHTRFEHSLGTMFVAGLMGTTLAERAEEESSIVQITRLQGLLHDIGHGPFSHVFEPVMEEFCGLTHEDMSRKIIEKSEIADILSSHGFDPKNVADLSVGLKEGEKVLNKVIRSPFDADKLDFTNRDSYHTGAGYYIDVHRIAYNVEIFDGELCLNIKALPTMESLVISRLLAFRSIYFHRTSRAAQVMMIEAMRRIARDVLEIEETVKDVDRYLDMDDFTVWCALKRDPRTRQILEDLANRRLLKVAYEMVFYRKEGEIGFLDSRAILGRLREEISARADVDLGDIFIDIPLLRTVPVEGFEETITFLEPEGRGRVALKAEEISPIISQLKRTLLSIVRIYTRKELVNRVEKAAKEVLSGEERFYHKVSY